MEKYYTRLNTWQDRLDSRWKQLPQGRKRHIILYSFAGYLLITLAIVLQVAYEVGDRQDSLDVEHIDNPFANPGAAGTREKQIQELKRQNNERE